jgi:hypothetical protein
MHLVEPVKPAGVIRTGGLGLPARANLLSTAQPHLAKRAIGIVLFSEPK